MHTSAALITIVFLQQASGHILESCKTEICTTEANRLLEYLDQSQDPCESFYEFSCGSFLKSAQGNEKLGLSLMLEEQAKKELLETYSDSVQGGDHKMVKFAKMLFAACMDEDGIEKDDLKTIKDDLKVLGGWPVLDGASWSGEESFDWIETMEKLRELGYFYSVFFDLIVKPDGDANTYILKIIIKYDEYYVSYLDDLEVMTDVAVIFGAPDKSNASKEMKEVYDLKQELNKLEFSGPIRLQKMQVGEFQQKYGTINWLEFINNFTSPGVTISKDDYVLFATPQHLIDRIKMISKLPKRTLANYMIWKVIEETLPYLTRSLRILKEITIETREDFCLTLMDKSFTINPLNVIHNRRHVPQTKHDAVTEMLQNIKSELSESISRIDWMQLNDKEKVVEKVNEINIVIGQPGNYYDDKMLDEMDVDMVECKEETFLSLLTRANRNRQSAVYRKIKQTVPKISEDAWYFRSYRGLPFYYDIDNVLFIPTINVHDPLFDENQPQYLNYGQLGFIVAQKLYNFMAAYVNKRNGNGYVEKWSNETRRSFAQELECIKTQMEHFALKQSDIEISCVIQDETGAKIAYGAYGNWLKNNSEELKLSGVEYTPRQLFWISAATTICQPVQGSSILHAIFKEPNFYSNLVSVSMGNSKNFANDFSCLPNTKMNPNSRCKIL